MRPGFGQFKFPSSEYLRFAAQYGVKDILLNTPVLEQSRPGVWSKKELIKLRLNIESYGLQLSAIENVPTDFYDHIMLGGEKSDQQIENMIENISNIADAGIPIFGYNWMPSHVWRTDPVTIRGGAIATAFDYSIAKQIPNTHDREYTEKELWENLENWIKIITPIAEKKNIKLGIHPCDPPLEKDVVAKHLVEGGRISSKELLDSYEVKDVIEMVGKFDSYFKLTDAIEQYKTSKSLIDFEVAITKFIFTNYVKKLRNIALSIGTIFYFIFRAENEHENLKRITYGKRYDLPIDKIKEMLLL